MEAWQRDPWRWEAEVDVLACAPSSGGRWHVRTSPGILFPTGGGQPHDTGSIGDAKVLDVVKGADGVVHVTDGPVPLGPAMTRVDGARRRDHMEQHTGQHLLTATLLRRWDIPTTSFHLGPDRVAIELATPTLTATQLADAEDVVNELIAQEIPIWSDTCEPDELGARGVRSRGLPEGFAGTVRLVGIGDLDVNTCGGTHLRHTGQLRVCRLLGVEGVGARGCRLYFLYGGRVLRRMREDQATQAALTRLLSVGAAQQPAAVEQLQADRKATAQRSAALGEHLVDHLVQALLQGGSPALASVADVDAALIAKVVGRVAEADPTRLVAVAAPDSGLASGVFAVAGPVDQVKGLQQALLAAVEGRGGGAQGRLQGRAARLDRWASFWSSEGGGQ